MNGAPPVEQGWSAQRWTITILLLFGFQLWLTWQLADRSPLKVRQASRSIQLRVAPDAAAPDLLALLNLKDPTRFVIPRREGFSGPAWLNAKPLQYRSPGWSSPPQWLALKPEELLEDFQQFATTNRTERTALTKRWSQPTETRVSLAPEQMPPGASRIEITGDLTKEDLVQIPEPPTIESTALLPPTIIVARVDQQGRIFSASLAGGASSGSAIADQTGLQLVRSLRFKANPGFLAGTNARDFDQLREARIILHWWVRPPTATTNTPVTVTAPIPRQ